MQVEYSYANFNLNFFFARQYIPYITEKWTLTINSFDVKWFFFYLKKTMFCGFIFETQFCAN